MSALVGTYQGQKVLYGWGLVGTILCDTGNSAFSTGHIKKDLVEKQKNKRVEHNNSKKPNSKVFFFSACNFSLMFDLQSEKWCMSKVCLFPLSSPEEGKFFLAGFHFWFKSFHMVSWRNIKFQVPCAPIWILWCAYEPCPHFKIDYFCL